MNHIKLMEKICLGLVFFCVVCTAVLAAPILQVTSSTSQVLVPLGSTANVNFTIHNVSGASLPISQVTPKYNGSSASATMTTNNCTNTTLANNASCTETIELSGSSIGTDSLNVWVYAFNGTIGSKSNVSVSVVSEGYAISGTISGLTTSGLVLQNNGSDDLALSSGSTSFQFSTPVASGGSYSVTVATQPTGQTCTVSNGSGSNVTSTVSNVSITCSTNTYTVGGTISGLTASGLVLQNNASDDLSVSSGATSFQFSTEVAYGGSYSVTVSSQPTGLSCTVSNGTGSNVTADVTDVSISCATTSNLKCWGRNQYGQLGQGNTVTYGTTPTRVGDNPPPIELGTGRTATAVSTNLYNSCAVLDNGSMKCWGRGNNGQLGQGSTETIGNQSGQMGDDLPPIDLGTGRTATATTEGIEHSCAILDDATMKCWGGNVWGQLGQGNTTTIGNAPGEMGDYLAAIDLGTSRTATKISAGFANTCALLDDQSMKCWGQNNWGQLGRGNTKPVGNKPGQMGDRLAAIDLGTGRSATAITSGYAHNCALLDDGTVKCWGQNAYGQLGQGINSTIGDQSGEMGNNLDPIDLGTGRTARAITAGNYHTCAILDNATMKCWGRNDYGQLGQGSTTNLGNAPGEMGDNLPPIDLGTGRTAIAITAGNFHTCAILDNVTMKCWGRNEYGQLVQGNTTTIGNQPGEMGDNLSPINLGTGLTAISTAASGSNHTCVVVQ